MEKKTVFDVFKDDVPKDRQHITIQTLYEYEKHYMKLVAEYKEEISFIEKMLSDYRQEQVQFFKEDLPAIKQKLENEHVDEAMESVWLKRLADNMERSFNISEKLITNYSTKKIDEFKDAVNEKLHGL